MLEYRRY